MTKQQAIAKADRIAKKTGEHRYVVLESGEYETASEFDLDTYFLGINEANIVYSTVDGHYS